MKHFDYPGQIRILPQLQVYPWVIVGQPLDFNRYQTLVKSQKSERVEESGQLRKAKTSRKAAGHVHLLNN